MHSPRVKICGITQADQARRAVECGADAIGLVFYPESPRAVSAEQAASIASICGPFVSVVGLFVDAQRGWVEQLLRQVPLHVLQFHGNESVEYCEHFARPYLKALRMRPDMDPAAAMATYPSASGILLDAYRPGVPGGTGDTFDWQRVPKQAPRPLVLAGGLTPDNVAAAVAATGCYGVDVSGGVESAPGIKDPRKVEQFIINARCGAKPGE